MNLRDFADVASLTEKTEIEKVGLLAFFVAETNGQALFSLSDVTEWFNELGFAKPNTSRLRKRILGSKKFVRGAGKDSFRVSAAELKRLKAEFPSVVSPSEEIVSEDTIVPSRLYEGTRGYIECLARQINASFEHNIFDGAAVLMRRLFEILLVHAYEACGQQGSIQDADGNYLMLERIVKDAKQNGILALSRNSKSSLDVFRELGNYSAHKIYYNAVKSDIESVAFRYRALIEELLYKAGIKK